MNISKKHAKHAFVLLLMVVFWSPRAFAIESQVFPQEVKSEMLPHPVKKAGSASPPYHEKKKETNNLSILTMVVSGLGCTCARFGDDMRNVLNDLRPGGLRILPVLGNGGLQNADDILFLKGIDMGVVEEDNLRLMKQKDPRLYAGIENHIQYITKLYNSEFHVLARNDIKNFDDLRGKKVNFNLAKSQSEATAEVIFDALKIEVQKTNFDNDRAIEKLKNGDIAAMIILSGAPQAVLAKVKKEDGAHFLALDQESLPNHDLSAIDAAYLPSVLTHELYPNLIPEGESVPTVANRALLATFASPENSPRYKKLAKFVQKFFDNIDEFHDSARHPKWKEINLAAQIPGWTRFKPAAQWLAAHQNASAPQTSSPLPDLPPELKPAFERFMRNHEATAHQQVLTANDQEKLFREFMGYVETQKLTPPAQ